MLIALLAVVLVLLGTGFRACRSRKRFIWEGVAFRCRFRNCGYSSTAWPRLRRRWSRPMWARWDGDELLIRRGPVFDRTVTLRATVATGGVHRLPVREATRCGPRPVAVCLRVSDGSHIDLVAPEESRLDLVGPYLVAAIHGLPGASAPHSRS